MERHAVSLSIAELVVCFQLYRLTRLCLLMRVKQSKAASLTVYRNDIRELEGTRYRAHLPLTKVFPRLAVNKTILKPRLAVATGRASTHMWDFPDVIKFRIAYEYDIG